MMREGGWMDIRLPAFLLAVTMAGAQAQAAERGFTVTGFDRVRVDGPYKVRLTTGVAPFARASGSASAIDGVSIAVQGQTLVIRKSASNWGGYPGESRGPVEILAGTHDLSTAWLNGSGLLEINGVRGQSFDLAMVGSGSVSIGKIQVDRLTVGISGSGSARLGGTAARTTAIARGTASLDGSQLTAKDAIIGAEGAAIVRLTATGTAKIETQGTASVEVGGRPACTVRASGSAVVTGCR
jgi:hypothetical protein